MYRVVTKTMVTQNGIRKREIDLGPWQEMETMATHWAKFFEASGRYDSVEVQSNGQRQVIESPEESLSF